MTDGQDDKKPLREWLMKINECGALMYVYPPTTVVSRFITLVDKADYDELVRKLEAAQKRILVNSADYAELHTELAKERARNAKLLKHFKDSLTLSEHAALAVYEFAVKENK